MSKKHHPLSKAERLELELKHSEQKKKNNAKRSIRLRIKDSIRNQETQDELKGFIADH